METIAIIGGSGFIGSRLSYRLDNNAELRFGIIDKSPSLFFPEKVQIADVRSLDQLRNAFRSYSHSGLNTIVNLAAEHRDNVLPLNLYYDVNVEGAKNICIVASELSVSKIVFTSSVAVYGFAPIDTSELGEIAPYNDYGRSKFEAENILRAWQSEDPGKRTLVIIRPTVVFGEQNRGNVYNLLRQIVSGKFLMIGNGANRKSLAYVENIAAFIEFSTNFKPGVHLYNFIDKPDFSMNQLVLSVKKILGRPQKIGPKLPFVIGYAIGKAFDLLANISGKQFAISAIRVKKFCANSVYNTAIIETGFVPPIPLDQALERTIRHEFIEQHDDELLFFSE